MCHISAGIFVHVKGLLATKVLMVYIKTLLTDKICAVCSLAISHSETYYDVG